MRLPKDISRFFNLGLGIVLGVIAISVPLGYLVISYQYVSGNLISEAQEKSAVLSEIITKDAHIWEYMQVRYDGYMKERPLSGEKEIRRILNNNNKIVAEVNDNMSRPYLMRSAPLFDSAKVVGKIEIYRSLRPVLVNAFWILLLSGPLSVISFIFLREFVNRIILRAEVYMDEGDKNFRDFVMAQPSPILLLDAKGDILLCNDTSVDVFGSKTHKIVGKNIFSHMPEIMTQGKKDLLNKAIATKKPVTYEENIGERLYETVAAPIMNISGDVDKIALFPHDITDRVKAEGEIKSFSQKLETIINSSSDIIILKDKDLRMLIVNEQTGKFFGKPVKDIIGKTDFDVMPEEAAAACQKSDEKALESETAVHSEEFVSGRYMYCVKQRVLDSAGNVNGVVAVIRDVTESKIADEERIRSQKLESIGLLAGGLAHDFNNVLTAIINNIALVKLAFHKEDKNFIRLSSAENSAFRAQALTQQLLTFSRGGEPVTRTVLINRLIEETVDFALRGSNIKCVKTLPGDLWPVVIDEGQISQVIHNLIINACQAMPSGGLIEVIAENKFIKEGELPLEQGKYVRLSVKDMGIGISEEYLSKVFDPYFTTKHKGSGLGLASTYSIIKKHRGYINVESSLGKGSAFYFYLPASNEDISEENLAEKLYFGRGRILVMDDEPDVRDSLGEMLNLLGYETSFASDGAEAIENYKRASNEKNPFIAVIMDLTIPGGMGGQEAIRELLKIYPGARAIVSSGYSNDPAMSHFKEYGFKGVVSKPYKISELSEVVYKVAVAAS